ncbi:MAG: MFS transporter [Vulcanimicrobiaceae bacterium]
MSGQARLQTPSLGASVLYNALWAPIHSQDAAIMTIAVPALLLRLAPDSYRSDLAVIASVVAVASMIVPPIAGIGSDRLRRAGVPRRRLVVVGTAVDVVALVAALAVPSPLLLGVALVLAAIGINITQAAYQAIIPEVFPRETWGAASGVRGIAALLGSVAGLAVAGIAGARAAFATIAGLMAVGAATTFAIPEGEPVADERVEVADWFDFVIVFIARSCVVLGLSLLMTYVLYFFHDVLHVANPAGGTGLVAGCALLGALGSSIALGALSDRVRRKWIVACSGVPMALAALGFALFPSERWILGFAVLFGIGYGGIISTGWALAIDSVPQLRDVARDLGIWGIAQNLPAVFAPLIGGAVLAKLGPTLFAYQLLFAGAAASFALGSVVVLAIRRA